MQTYGGVEEPTSKFLSRLHLGFSPSYRNKIFARFSHPPRALFYIHCSFFPLPSHVILLSDDKHKSDPVFPPYVTLRVFKNGIKISPVRSPPLLSLLRLNIIGSYPSGCVRTVPVAIMKLWNWPLPRLLPKGIEQCFWNTIINDVRLSTSGNVRQSVQCGGPATYVHLPMHPHPLLWANILGTCNV
jgi:hypothetical protein